MPAFVRELVARLRRRGLPLGVDDCGALRTALAAGHGLESTEALRDLCVTLWAKSPRDAELIGAAMHLVSSPAWSAVVTQAPPAEPPAVAPAVQAVVPATDQAPATGATATGAAGAAAPDLTIVVPPPRTGTAEPPRSGLPSPFLVLRPQHPVSERDVAQIWRRLRRPVRQGPPTELDVDATLQRYARTGLVTAPVLIPPRANTARLLLLVDRDGSMTPYHGLVDHVVSSIVRAGRLDAITVAYFRNTPGRSLDRSALAALPDTFTSRLDPILERIPALGTGRVYRDPQLLTPWPVTDLLDTVAGGSAVAVVSDAGALRGSFVMTRLFDTVAFLLAVVARGAATAWLNPVDADRWLDTTAGQIARHVPMYPLTRDGMYRAVDALRGHPVTIERPL
jgi:uncharacterized protein with von Willebrand factor type A (vWA) domain